MLTAEQAYKTVLDTDAQAFYGLLKQSGFDLQSQHEQAAAWDLGVIMSGRDDLPMHNLQNYGNGLFGQLKAAVDQHLSTMELSPGIPATMQQKRASLNVEQVLLPDGLRTQAWQAAEALSQHPLLKEAAEILMASQEEDSE